MVALWPAAGCSGCTKYSHCSLPFTSSVVDAAAGWGTAPLLAEAAYTDRRCLPTLETQVIERMKAVINMSAVSKLICLYISIASNAGAYIRYPPLKSNATTYGAVSNQHA